jgi:PAS domain S-box-containing protein
LSKRFVAWLRLFLPTSFRLRGFRLIVTADHVGLRKGCDVSLPSTDPEKTEGFVPASSITEALLSLTLLEAIPDAIVVTNQQGIVLQINSQTEDLFGYKREELIGQKVEILVPERQRQGHLYHRERFTEQPRTRRMGAGLELYGRRQDGSEFPVEISLSPVATKNGMLVLSAVRDVSDRKRAEEELRRAQEELNRRRNRQLWDYQSRLALIADSSQDAIIGKNLDGIITHWNKGAEQIYGYKSEEVIGKSISLLAPKDRDDEIPAILEKIREGKRVDYFESIRVAKDGRRLNVSISVSPIWDAEGKIVGASAIARDITAQKRAEDQLRQAQKMEAIGRLAGGVAHDFNNILGIIAACGELLRSRVDSNPDLQQYLDNLKQATERGASLTRQLLAFSRKQPIQPRVLDLNERLKEVGRLVRPLMGDDVQLIILPHAASAIIEADVGQVDQIVLNLAVNARDAMPEGGKLILETAMQEFDQAFADRHPPITPGKYVMLAVSDNGCGMDQATVARIFEPFFTTKEIGKGTGLGLATVYGIVKQNSGQIWVYSEPGRGTTFKIYLPSADYKIGGGAEPPPELPPRRNGTRVLLVEDDAIMRALTREILEEHGYLVLEAQDGKSALELLARNNDWIEIALTDVVMRGMSGPQLALRLTELRPSIKIVYMSGYTGELLEEHAGAGITLLEKPFTRTSLLRELDAVLR